jgi:hypothetical protein
MPNPSAPDRLAVLVLIVGVVVMVTAPVVIGGDGLVRAESLDHFLTTGTLDASRYSCYGPLAAAPLWLLGRPFGYSLHATWLFNRLAVLAGVLLLTRLFRDVWPLSVRLRFAALLLLGSLFPWHTMYFYGEVFHVVCVGWGLALIALRPGRPARLGWLLAVWGTANVPATSVGLALASLVLCAERRRWRYLLLPALAAVLILLENAVRRGDMFDSGYANDGGNRTVLPYSGRPGFSYPFFFGVLSILFSFGKGLLFFTPGLFLRYPASGTGTSPGHEAGVRLVYRLWLAVVVGLVLVYARWWSWYGGAVWGPRFFLFASLPASLVLACRTAGPQGHSLGANLLLLLVLTLSCWVAANGLVFDVYDHDLFWGHDFAQEHLMWYVPECGVLWRPFVTPKPLEWYDQLRLAGLALGFVYLARPIAGELVRQLRRVVRTGWTVLRHGPAWRL